MAKSIFSGEVASGLQDLENRYEACRAIFDRARNINSRGVFEDGDPPNPTVEALTDFTSGRIISTRPEETGQL